MKRLHLVVEGHLDAEAVPQLALRVLLALHRHPAWGVTREASRLPRSRLVNESVRSPKRPPSPFGMEQAVALAHSNRANALLVVVDSDDDCAATFGPSASAMLATRLPASAVMAVREYEAWLLGAYPVEELEGARVANPEAVRDAKGALKRLFKRKGEPYRPSTDMRVLSKSLPVDRVRKRCPSFDKFYREVERLTAP